MDCAPPCGIGQPTVCAAMPRTSPKAAETGDSKGRKEWAANPANSARARTPVKRLSATARAERTVKPENDGGGQAIRTCSDDCGGGGHG
jgi:hypothetical protein